MATTWARVGLQGSRVQDPHVDGFIFATGCLVSIWDSSAGWRDLSVLGGDGPGATVTGMVTLEGGIGTVRIPGMRESSVVTVTPRAMSTGRDLAAAARADATGGETAHFLADAGMEELTITAVDMVGEKNSLDRSTVQFIAIL